MLRPNPFAGRMYFRYMPVKEYGKPDDEKGGQENQAGGLRHDHPAKTDSIFIPAG